MSLAIVFESLPSTVRRHEPTFQRDRATEPVFAPYTTATALLETLSMSSALRLPERQAIVQALLRRYRSVTHPLWQALLLRAFEPTLRTLYTRDRGANEDRGQRILVAFLQALSQVRPEGPIFLKVSRATARALFREVRAAREDVEPIRFDELSADCAPSPHLDPPPFVTCLVHEVVDQLAQHRGGTEIVQVLAGLETVDEQATRLSRPTHQRETGTVTRRCIDKRRQRALRQMRAELTCQPKEVLP